MTEGRRRIAKSDERAYLYGRGIAVVMLAAVYGLGFVRLTEPIDRILFFGALVGFSLVGLVQCYFLRVRRTELKRTMLYALLPDIVMVGMFTAALTGTGDLGFALAISWPVLYALVLRRREAWLVAGSFAAAYVIGSMPSAALGFSSVTEILMKAFVIVLIGGRVAYSEQLQRWREEQIELASLENERLNAELHTSLGELQALFEITDYIHASLDFDMVATPVLETIARALGIERCALVVIDTSTGTVLSSAALGLPIDLALPPGAGADASFAANPSILEDGLVCFSPFEQANLRLVLCSRAEDVARLTENDHLLLQAIGREVAVAVDNSMLYKLTKRMAVTDELTGLHNYRFLQQRINEEVARARRYNSFTSLLMIDADDFKAFNDAYGHVAGDRVLAELGEVLSANVRECDLVARYGGEEFSVLLPETDMMGALAVAEKLRDAVAEHGFQRPYDRRLSVSIGLASYPTHGIDAESVLRAADDALYGAKNSGKNQVHTPGIYDGQLV